MSSCVDLHAHTTASDGSLTPTALVRLARQSELAAVAITDHDTVAGCAEARAAGAAEGIEVVAGVEVSAVPELPGQLHLVGLLVEPGNPRLEVWLTWVRGARNRRNPKIVERLQALGISITLAEVQACARARAGAPSPAGPEEAVGGAAETVVGRPHIAEVLVAKGVVRSPGEAFERFLAKGAPAYVDRERATPAEAIEVIHQAGGLVVLAHPLHCKAGSRQELAEFLRKLKELGLDGLEVHYPTHTADEEAMLARLARQLGLLASGGSDFHGQAKPGLRLGAGYGGLRVPLALLEAMKAAKAGC